MVDKVGGVEYDVNIDASGAVSGGQKIIKNNERIEDSFQDIDSSSKKSSETMVKGSNKASKAIGGMSRKAGMAGVQVQQLVGQIQGGQNVFGALSAQAADLGIVLGAPLLGAVAGLGAAFAGVLLPSLFDTEDKTDELIIKLKELAETQILTKEQAALLAQEERKLIKEKKAKIESVKDEIKENKNQVQSMVNTIKRGKLGAKAYVKLSGNIKDAKQETVKYNAEIATLNQEIKLSEKALGFYESSMDGSVKQTNKQKEAVSSLVDAISNQAESIGKTNREIAINEATQRGATSAQIESINASFDAIEAEEKRKKAIVDARKAEIQANAELHKEKSRIEKERLALESASAARVSAVDAIRQDMATEAELRDQKFASDIEALQIALQNEEIKKAEYDALELARVQAHADQLIDIEKRTANERTEIERKHNQAVSSFRSAAIQNAMGLLDVFAGESRIAAIAAIAINKGLALAQNTQNTLVAQTRALAELGPIAGPPVAAKIGAYGAINAGLIAATGLAQAARSGGGPSFSGGVQSTNVSSGASAQASSPSAGTQNISVSGISPDEFVRAGTIVDTINGAIADGYTINFAGG
jgi:hypothetical protein